MVLVPSDRVQRYVKGDQTFYKKAIFPTIRQCVKKEDILLVQGRIAEYTKDDFAGPDMRVWSSFLDDIFFNDDNVKKVDKDYREIMNKYNEDIHYQSARFGVGLLMALT
jgi:hypothetical protein